MRSGNFFEIFYKLRKKTMGLRVSSVQGFQKYRWGDGKLEPNS